MYIKERIGVFYQKKKARIHKQSSELETLKKKKEEETDLSRSEDL